MGILLTEDQARKYQSVINRYSPSGDIVNKFKQSNFAVIAGPTGAGKDTIRNKLLENYSSYTSILSTTSRPPRQDEKDGVEYHFRDLDFFDQGFLQRRFLQVALVHGQQISCLDSTDINELDKKQIALSILVVQTELELRQLKSNIKTIFVVTPNLETLKIRMKKGRNISREEINRRLQAAQNELKIALTQKDYFCVVNDDIERTVNICNKFLTEGEFNRAEDSRARTIARTIYNQLSLIQ